MELLEKVKINLRIFHTALDADILSDIEACKKDLSVSGVGQVDELDQLTEKAIKLYCRLQHDYGGKGDQYEKAYNSLKAAMALCGDYRGGEHV